MVSTKHLANIYERINSQFYTDFQAQLKEYVQIFKNENYNLDIRLDNDITGGSQWLKKVRSTGKKSLSLVLTGQPPPAQSRLKKSANSPLLHQSAVEKDVITEDKQEVSKVQGMFCFLTCRVDTSMTVHCFSCMIDFIKKKKSFYLKLFNNTTLWQGKFHWQIHTKKL